MVNKEDGKYEQVHFNIIYICNILFEEPVRVLDNQSQISDLWHCMVPLSVFIREGFPKKVAVLLDFVQMRGGGRTLPKSFVHYSQTVYIGSIWGWGGRGRPHT